MYYIKLCKGWKINLKFTYRVYGNENVDFQPFPAHKHWRKAAEQEISTRRIMFWTDSVELMTEFQ